MKKLLSLVVLVGLGGFLWWWFSPVQVLSRKTDHLLELMSFEKGAGKTARQTGVYSINALLAAEVELASDSHPEMNGMRERTELESLYAWMAEHVVESSFKRLELRKLEVREPVAEVEFVVDGMVELPGTRPVNGKYEVFLLWMHDGSEWRLGHARWREAGGGR